MPARGWWGHRHRWSKVAAAVVAVCLWRLPGAAADNEWQGQVPVQPLAGSCLETGACVSRGVTFFSADDAAGRVALFGCARLRAETPLAGRSC